MTEEKSWRDVYKVHPAADLFPMLPEDELRKLGEDIKANGLREPIALFRPEDDAEAERISILDGRNRLAAIVLLGLPISTGWPRKTSDGSIFPAVRYVDGNPEAYVISKNIHRRHLTKEQQAELIVKVMKATEADLAKAAKSVEKDDLAKVARSFSPERGKRGGSTKDTIKEKVVEEAKKHGISKRTAETALAKHRGPQHAPQQKKHLKTNRRVPTDAPVVLGLDPRINVESVSRKAIAFLKKELGNSSNRTVLEVLMNICNAFNVELLLKDEGKKLSRPEISGEWETINR